MLGWKLTNIQMQIGNYNCYKAILVKGQELLGYKKGLSIIAWYTPTIPVPFGPINFGALPGLILQLEVGPKTYYVDKINFNKQYTITPLSKGRLMTIEQYSNFLNSFFDDNFGK